MDDQTSQADLYADARYTAEISSRMQVPDRIMMNNDQQSHAHSDYRPSSPTSSHGGGEEHDSNHFNDLGMRRRDPRLDMQVPDRILVMGGEQHLAARSTPRELQLENAVMPTSPEHARVITPPRSIKLDELPFPSATDDESMASLASSTPTMEGTPRAAKRLYDSGRKTRGAMSNTSSEAQQLKDSHSLALLSDVDPYQRHPVPSGGGGLRDLSPSEEMQLVRRQLAKLNHRLMAVELENQQQQQREMLLTVVVSAYFIGKLVIWINRSM